MGPEAARQMVLRFGAFELDLNAGQIRKSGALLKLRPQALRVLTVLASRSGQVVTREDIQKEIWSDSVVDFEQGLNFCIRQIRAVLGDDPDSPRFIETIPRRGYRFLVPVMSNDRVPVPAVDEGLNVTKRSAAPVSIRNVRHVRRVTRRDVIWFSAVAAASAVSGWTAWKLWPVGSEIRSLAVLPFENKEKEDDAEFLCDGLTDSLIRQIAALPPLTVKRGGVFKGKIVDPQAAGRQLGVDAIVSGSVTRRSGKLYISAEFVDVRTGAVLWSARYDRDQADLLLIQDQIASAIIDEGIRLKLSRSDRQRLVRHATNDQEANELYMRAVFYEGRETEGDYLTARKLLLEAIDKDKKFALAFAELAMNYTAMAVDGYARPTEAWPLVKRYAEQALVLDPTLLEAHALLGAEAFWNQWNWPLAEQQYQMAMRAPAYRISLSYAFERWAVGRPDDALRLIREARVLEPLVLLWKLREADMLLQTGQTQRAAEIYEEIIRDSREDSRAYFGLAEVRSAQGKFDEAIAQLRLGYDALGEMDDSLLEVLAKARGPDGYRRAEKAAAQLELETLATRTAANMYVSPLDFARAHARLGHKEKVFDYLDAAFTDRAPGLMFLKVDHVWDSIRNEQRFRDAVKRIGLP